MDRLCAGDEQFAGPGVPEKLALVRVRCLWQQEGWCLILSLVSF